MTVHLHIDVDGCHVHAIRYVPEPAAPAKIAAALADAAEEVQSIVSILLRAQEVRRVAVLDSDRPAGDPGGRGAAPRMTGAA